jgi:hypothetical protein
MTRKKVIPELERLWRETDKAGRDAILDWIAHNKDNRPREDYPLVPSERHEALARAQRLGDIGDFIARLMKADPGSRFTRSEFARELARALPEASLDEAWQEYLIWGQVDGWTYREATDEWKKA